MKKNNTKKYINKKSAKLSFNLIELNKNNEEIEQQFWEELWDSDKKYFNKRDSKIILNYLQDELYLIHKGNNEKVYGVLEGLGIVVNSNNRIVGTFTYEDYDKLKWQLQREKLKLNY